MLRPALLCWALVLASRVEGVCHVDCAPHRTTPCQIACTLAGLTAPPVCMVQDRPFTIDLSFNNITILRNNVFRRNGYRNVTYINLNNNGLRTIKEYAFRGLPNLTKLSLADNDIIEIPAKAFPSVPELEVLDLDGNPGIELPNCGFNHSKLGILYLCRCGLTTIPPYFFHGMPNLGVIYLSDNNLTTFNVELIKPLKRLQFLILQGNAFTTVQPELLEVLPQTLFIDFRRNALHCECNMTDTQYLNEERHYYVDLQCNGPTITTLENFFKINCTRRIYKCDPLDSSMMPITNDSSADINKRMSQLFTPFTIPQVP